MSQERLLPVGKVDERPQLTIQQMHEIGKVFGQRLFTDERVAPKLTASKLRIRFEYYDERWGNDETSVTADFSADPIAFYFGPCDVKPEVTMRMHADTAHRFFMQKLNMMIAVAKGEIKVKGPLHRAMKLLPTIKPGFEIYRKVLNELGFHELLKYPRDKKEMLADVSEPPKVTEQQEPSVLPHQAKEEGNG